jgi:predicted  nucleic acid-binding Zn-ribbon protein
MSNFTYCDGTLTLTKHQIRNSQNIKQKLGMDEIGKLQCVDCGNSYKTLDKILCQCDECGAKRPIEVMEEIGETIVLCSNCLSKYKHFQDFKIFGLRGPDKKARKKRYEESIGEVPAMAEMPEEIRRIYEEGIEGNVSNIPFETAGERNPGATRDFNVTVDMDNIASPPRGGVSPQEFTSTSAVYQDTNTDRWVVRRNLNPTDEETNE